MKVIYHFYTPEQGILSAMDYMVEGVAFNPDAKDKTDPQFIIKITGSEPKVVYDVVKTIVNVEAGDAFVSFTTSVVVDASDNKFKETL